MPNYFGFNPSNNTYTNYLSLNINLYNNNPQNINKNKDNINNN